LENIKKAFDLKEEIQTSQTDKEIPIAKFNNDEWMCEFTCLVDKTPT
jgi:hypothetical protein